MQQMLAEPIPSEEALWDLLRRISENPELAAEIRALKIAGWQPQILYFPDEPIGHSIRPTLARAVTEFHASVSKAYALVVYGEPNRQLLKNTDKEILDLMFLVTDGSNGLNMVEEAVDKLVEGLLKKMTGKQIVAIVIIFLLLYFGQDVAKDYFAGYFAHLDSDTTSAERITLNEHETERIKLLTEMMQKFGVKPELKAESDEALKALTRPATQQDRSAVRGVEITREQARTVTTAPRQEREGRRLDGIYKVNEITDVESGFLIRIENIETGEEFSANASYTELTGDDVHIIFQVAEKKTTFHALINAFYVGDKISQAFILRADHIVPNGGVGNNDEERE
jgi:hypothetical protein